MGQALADAFSDGNELFLWDKEDVDITRIQDTRDKILEARPDVVINSAAYNDVDGAESNPELAKNINGYAVGNLARVCKEIGPILVHYSSEYVFDGRVEQGYSESDTPSSLNVYGNSKLLGEQELQKNTDKFYLLRLSRMFGKPAAAATSKKSFVELMISLAKTKESIDVVDDELSCMTYAPDLAERTKYILENKLPFGIYHCANEGSATWYGFAQEIFKISKINVKLNSVSSDHFLPRPAKRPQYGILLNTKLPLQRSWREALKEFLNSSKL